MGTLISVRGGRKKQKKPRDNPWISKVYAHEVQVKFVFY